MASNLGTLGSIFIDLRANAADFESDMGRTARVAEKHARELRKQAAEIGAAVGAAAAAQALAFGAMVKHAIDSADHLNKARQAAGMTAEALSQMQYAARLSDVDDLDKQLAKLSRSAAAAADGTGEQADAFKALGVSVKNADGSLRSNEQILLDVADAFAKYGDGAAKSAVAQTLFGKEGAAMIPFLNQGSAAIREAMKEADQFGLTVKTEAGKAAEEFNDNLTRVRASAEGLANRVAHNLLPVLVDLSNQWIAAAKDADNIAKATSFADKSVKGLILSAIAAKAVFESLGKVIGATLATTGILIDGPTDFLPPKMIYNMAKHAGEIKEVWSAALDDARAGLTDDFEALAKVIAAGNQQIAEANKAAERQQDQQPQLRLISRTAAKFQPDPAMAAELKAALQHEEDLRRAAEQLGEALKTPDEKLTEQVALFDELYNEKMITADQRTRALAAANEEYYKSLAEIGDEAEKTFNGMTVFAEQAARNMQDAFAEFLFDPFKDGLSGLLMNFLKVLQRMAAEAAAAQIFRSIGAAASSSSSAWLQMIGSVIGSVAGGAMGGAASGGSYSGVSLDYSVPTSFGGYMAKGGDVTPGSGYIVGEHEPEWFEPSASGRITPLSKLGGGNTYNVTANVDARGATAADADVIAKQTAAALREMVRQQMVDERRPGGLLSAA